MAGKKPARDPNLVVGASYSHADILKFESLCVVHLLAADRRPANSHVQKPVRLRLSTQNPPIHIFDDPWPRRHDLAPS